MSGARRASAAPTINAVRVDHPTDDHAGVVTYTVLIDAAPVRQTQAARRPRPPETPPHPAQTSKSTDDDRRDAPRQRTRLRSGKIIDASERFLTECLVHDLSESGMRLRLPSSMALPPSFQVYDDLAGRLIQAQLTWRRGEEAGVRFIPSEETARSRTTAADMRRKFYKMPR